MDKFKKFTKTPLFGAIIGGVATVGVIAFMVISYIADKKETAYVESLDRYERFFYDIEKAEKNDEYDTVKELVEEHLIYETNYEEYKNNLGNEKFNYIKNAYNTALEKLYIEQVDEYGYDLKVVLEEAYSDEYLTSELDEFMEIEREIIDPELERKLYSDEMEQALLKVEKEEIARSIEFDKEWEEKKIYDFMEKAYDQLTNYGENYNPEIHDPMVAKLASEEFGISEYEAGRIYVKVQMAEYEKIKNN